MKTNRLAVALTAVAVSAVAADESSTNATSVATLPPVTIEASRLGKTADRMPGAVQVIARDQIVATGARSVAEVLERRAPSVSVIRTGAGNPALAQIGFGGYGENGFGRALVRVDGQRLNFADMSAPMLTDIDLGSVNRLEILPGSQAVLHGEAASAGMINVITEPENDGTHGRFSVYGGSWNTVGARAALRGGDDESGTRYWFNGGWEHSDGFRANNGWQTLNASGGIRQDWTNGSYLRVSAFENAADYELPGYLPAAAWKDHRRRSNTPRDWYRRATGGVTLSAEGVLNEDNRLHLDFAFSRSKMKSRSYSFGSYTDYNPNDFWKPTNVEWSDDYRMFYDLYSCELTPEWINTTDLLGFENEVIVGAMYRYDRLHARTHDRGEYFPDFWKMSGASRVHDEYNRQAMGVFAQETFHVTDEIALETGGRYQRTWSENTALVSERRIADTYAADAGLLYAPVEGLKTFVKVARFFRNPFLDENPYRNYKAQRILSPETGWRTDVGAEYEFLDEFSVFADAFVSKTKHEILYDKFVWGQGGNNLNAPSDVLREGLTLGGGWTRDKVASVSLAYTYVKAEFDGGPYDGKDVPMVPESTVRANARVWLGEACSVFGGYRFFSSRRAYSDFHNDGSRLASAGIFNLGVRYEPQWEVVKGVSVTFTVDNLFDRHYADCATRSSAGYEVYYPAAGRSYLLAIAYEF